MDCLGAYAKVRDCPIIIMVPGLERYDPWQYIEVARLTCYASGYADTAFSVPANTRYRGKHVRGYFTHTDNDDASSGCVFQVMDSHKHLFADALTAAIGDEGWLARLDHYTANEAKQA